MLTCPSRRRVRRRPRLRRRRLLFGGLGAWISLAAGFVGLAALVALAAVVAAGARRGPVGENQD
jgi:hypothetical protein